MKRTQVFKISVLSLGLALSFISQAQTNTVCSDSDKGKNLEVEGVLTLKFFQDRKLIREQTYKDFFSGSRNRYLEFYCSGSQPAYEVIACPNEALGDACPVIERLAEEPKIQVMQGDPIFPHIITQSSRDRPVLNFSLTAYDGDVDLMGLHFVMSDPGSSSADVLTLQEIETARLYNFELYNSADELIAQTKSHAGRIFFDLGAEGYRLEGTEEFTVKIDMPAIEEIEQSWRWFRLSLDREYDGNGIQAKSVSTGNFVEGVVLGQIGAWPSSELFINAATAVSLRHASTQPEMVNPSLRGQEFYRFEIEAASAGTAEIEQVTLEVLLEGMEFNGQVEGRVFLVNDDGTVDFTKLVTDNIDVEVSPTDLQKGTITIDFRNQLILPGQINTYALFLNRTRDNNTGTYSYAFSLLTDNLKSTTREARLLKTASNIVWSDLPGFGAENRFMRGFLLDVDSSASVFIDR